MNPKYNYALGAANQSGIPPFDLSKVVMRIFPLRANYHSLQLFCDRSINIASEYTYVEPAAPYVLFCVINYGHMGNVASNLGYTSQNEVLFSVPLNWYRRRGKNDSWALQKSSSISPFIWVDQPSSAWTGRDVFGWPKSIAWLKSGLNEWTKDPTAPRTLFSLEALMYRELFAGERGERGVLLEIDQEQPSGLLKSPPDPMNALNPLLAWPKGVLRSLSVGGSLLETMTRLPAFGFPQWGDGANILEMMGSMFGDYNPIRSLPASNVLNLKQFRHPSYPQSNSYQAIVNSKMTPTSFSRGGMLGEPGLLRGDLAGGYRIRIHRYPAWPIIDSLGLRVSHEYEEQGEQVAVLEPVFPFWVDVDFEYGAGEVVCWRTYDQHWQLPPVDDGDKKDDCREREVEVNQGVDSPTVEQLAFQCGTCESPHLYNTAEGGAVEQVYGPFKFPKATVRVLPLMANWDALRKFTDGYLNFPEGVGPDGKPAETNIHDENHLKIFPGRSDPWDHEWKWDPQWSWDEGEKDPIKDGNGAYRGRKYWELSGLPDTPPTASGNLFIPWGRYVYMTITSYEDVISGLNIGSWAQKRVTFSYPVKWFKWVGETDKENKTVVEGKKEGKDVRGYWELKSFGVISPFMYVDTPTAATVGREMNGWNVAQAEIESPQTDWLLGHGGSMAQNLMSLTTDVVPALNANQKTEHSLLVEVTTRSPLDPLAAEDWKEVSATWGERQVFEAQTKANEAYHDEGRYEEPRRHLSWLKSIAMEVMFRDRPINHVALKQFRDAKDPNSACLQALNIYPETISRIYDLRPIDDPLYVAIHKYPSAAIVELLGLDVKWTDTSKGQPIEYLQAIRPFWMKADLKEDLGRDVIFRAGSECWQEEEGGTKLYFEDSEESATPTTAAELADHAPNATEILGEDWNFDVQELGSDLFFQKASAYSKHPKSEWKGLPWTRIRGGHLPVLRQARVSFSPQIVIESILNHRWVNLDPDFISFERKWAFVQLQWKKKWDKVNPYALTPSQRDRKKMKGVLRHDEWQKKWATLIPSGSIPNTKVREEFLKDYSDMIQSERLVTDPERDIWFVEPQNPPELVVGDLLDLKGDRDPDSESVNDLLKALRDSSEKREEYKKAIGGTALKSMVAAEETIWETARDSLEAVAKAMREAPEKGDREAPEKGDREAVRQWDAVESATRAAAQRRIEAVKKEIREAADKAKVNAVDTWEAFKENIREGAEKTDVKAANAWDAFKETDEKAANAWDAFKRAMGEIAQTSMEGAERATREAPEKAMKATAQNRLDAVKKKKGAAKKAVRDGAREKKDAGRKTRRKAPQQETDTTEKTRREEADVAADEDARAAKTVREALVRMDQEDAENQEAEKKAQAEEERADENG